MNLYRSHLTPRSNDALIEQQHEADEQARKWLDRPLVVDSIDRDLQRNTVLRSMLDRLVVRS